MATTLPPEFWENERQQLIAVLKPRMTQAAFASMQLASRKAMIGFNLNMANQAAAQWAEQYMDIVLTNIMGTSIEGIGGVVSEWVLRSGATVGELQQALSSYGAVRSSRIAVTEITRAFAEGEHMAYLDAGVKKWRWNTNNDGVVCDTCRPLNGKVVVIGEAFGTNKAGDPIIKPPDAHPNDRCWVSPVVEI